MPEFTIVTDSATPSKMAKFSVSDALKAGMTALDAAKMGFSCDTSAIKMAMDSDPMYRKAVEKFAQDAGFNLGDANIDALGQFFLYINEATINALYRGRTAAQTFGVKTVGDWTTEKVAFKMRELVSGGTGLYDDFSRPGFANYNYGWDVRDTLRIEWGLEVTKLEEAVASVMRRNAYQDKKDAVILTQEIWLNNFFWNGTTVGGKKLYGVFSDPNMAARTTNVSVPFTQNTTMAQVVAQLQIWKQNLATDLKGNGDVNSLPVTIACPLSYQFLFTAMNDYGLTAYDWLDKNWRNAKVEFKPELDDDERFVVFAKSVPGVGMDTINLMQTSKLRLVGAMPSLKGREEAYSASIAGAFVACPVGVRVYEN